MVIAHVLTSLQIGGGERVALELASAQARLGHRVMVVSLSPEPDGPLAGEFRARSIGIHRVVKRPGGLDPALVLRLAALFWRERVGVAHLHNRLPLIYGVPAARVIGAVAVHTRHGPRAAGGPGEEWLTRLAARGLHAYVAVSQDVKRRALEQREVATEKLSIIDNGVDIERFQGGAGADGQGDGAREGGGADANGGQGMRQLSRTRLGVPASAWVVGAVGRFAPEKDFPMLVRAVAPLLGEKSRLLLVGDGAEMATIRAEIARQNVEPFCILPGARSDVPECLAAMDVFVLCSRMEGMPIAVLEAMASGLPLVASAVGGLPALIDHGINGLLFPVGDESALRAHLRELRADRARGKTLARLGRQSVQAKHSREVMARQYLDLYAMQGAGT